MMGPSITFFVGLIHFVVGVLAVGCSLSFTSGMFNSGFGQFEVYWVAGLIVGFAGIAGGIHLMKSDSRAASGAGMPYQPPPKGEDDERLR